MNKNRRFNKWIVALLICVVAASLPGELFARDRGFNQSEAVGNVGGVGPGRNPGLNQPGAAGNVGGRGRVRDPGLNQPGAAGNR